LRSCVFWGSWFPCVLGFPGDPGFLAFLCCTAPHRTAPRCGDCLHWPFGTDSPAPRTAPHRTAPHRGAETVFLVSLRSWVSGDPGYFAFMDFQGNRSCAALAALSKGNRSCAALAALSKGNASMRSWVGSCLPSEDLAFWGSTILSLSHSTQTQNCPSAPLPKPFRQIPQSLERAAPARPICAIRKGWLYVN
jgi:hypothetical protein